MQLWNRQASPGKHLQLRMRFQVVCITQTHLIHAKHNLILVKLLLSIKGMAMLPNSIREAAPTITHASNKFTEAPVGTFITACYPLYSEIFFRPNYHHSHQVAAFQIVTGTPGTFEDQLQCYQSTEEIFLYQRPPDLLSGFKSNSPAQLTKTELENRKLFTENATRVFDLVLFECLSQLLSGYLWKGASPSLQHGEISNIAANSWMNIQLAVGGTVYADFVQSFAIAQQNWPGATEEEMAATDPWSIGAAKARRTWYLQQLQKAVSGWILHRGTVANDPSSRSRLS
jgi:hypothetical protein